MRRRVSGQPNQLRAPGLLFDDVMLSVRNNGKVLIAVDSKEHVMFLEIFRMSVDEERFGFRIYNSGYGLLNYHQRNPVSPTKFDLVFRVENVRLRNGPSGLNQQEVAKLFSEAPRQDAYYLYEWAKKKGDVVLRKPPQWNREQKGKDCIVESIHAFLVNNMERMQYKQFRIICLALILATAYESFEASGNVQPFRLAIFEAERLELGDLTQKLIYSAEDLVAILGMLDGKIRRYHQEFG
jgi:hypothetical protein